MKIKLNIKSIALMTIISLTSMLFINISFAANTGKITVETAKLRSQANTDATTLDLVSKGESVEILGEEDGWYKVKYKTLTGYIRKDLLKVESNEAANNVTNEKQTENTTENTVNNITENNTQTANNTTSENNTVTNNTVTENTTNTTNDNTAQNAETLKIEKDQKYKIKENVKIKVIPLISSIELDEVKKDDEVQVVEILDDWVKVRLSNSKEGWIRKDKLTAIQTETANNENTETTTENRDTQQTTSRGSTATRTKQTATKKTTAQKANTTKTTKANTSSKKTTTTSKATTNTTKTITESASTSSNGSAVVAFAKQYVGYKYVSGGASPSGFDCSGFTTYVYKHFGVTLNRTAAGQYSNGRSVTSLQAGDLLMFSYGKGISHVGIYIGGNQFIHAANSRSGVRIDSLSTYKSHYVGARRIF